MGVLLWVLIIGCVAGTIARVLMPGPNKPKGFVLTIVLGVAGAFLATYLGQRLGQPFVLRSRVPLPPAPFPCGGGETDDSGP